MGIDTVVFDLDGVILDSEVVWDEVRHDFAVSHGGHWGKLDQPAVMGANSLQWAAHMRANNGLQLSDREIYEGIIGELKMRYARHLPLIPGVVEAIENLSTVYRLGVASSSPRELIEYALELAGLRNCFAVVVSSDDVARGKPEPDVYREACARLGTIPERAVAIEDSASGMEAAFSAGLAVVAVPNPAYPPAAEAVAKADVVLGSIRELNRAVIATLKRAEPEVDDGK
jgi:HAD superfamily hydrolase (TIGR01509 family)